MYLNIVRAKVPFDSIFGNVIQLECDYNIGDIINRNGISYILTDTGNPEIILDNRVEDRFKAGKYVQVVPIVYIEQMESDTVLNISGFQRHEKTTRFYKVKDFDDNLNEVTDKKDFKDVTRYFYARN